MEIGSAGTSTGASTDTFSIRRRYFFMPKPFKAIVDCLTIAKTALLL
uniref:Uncharacterized protein n=1 Tax=Myoviridae sp. ctAca11 TaxID=2825043 RepID=A0A8S5Q795_9CAUD|nr:MAG TPA: hypothetical protein [Myoviridae sp. ctAca11]